MTRNSLKFLWRVAKKARHDQNFRHHALLEFWEVLREYLPARLVTRRRDYVFCRDLAAKRTHPPAGKWLPPLALAYRLSAYGVLVDEAGRLLMVSDKAMNFGWNLPGGGVHKSETLEAGLRREFEEETGLLVKVGPVLANADSFLIMPTGRAVHAVLHFYLVEEVGGTLLPEGNGFDTSRVEYIDLATIPRQGVNDHPFMLRLVEQARVLRATVVS